MHLCVIFFMIDLIEVIKNNENIYTYMYKYIYDMFGFIKII